MDENETSEQRNTDVKTTLKLISHLRIPNRPTMSRLLVLPYSHAYNQQTSDRRCYEIFCIALAEGNSPVSFYRIPKLEAMAFPVQFPTGENTLDEQHRPKKLLSSRYFNARLFFADNRFAKDTNYIFCCNLSQRCIRPRKVCRFSSVKENP